MRPADSAGYESPEKAASSLRPAQADERRFAMLLTPSILDSPGQPPGNLSIGRTYFRKSGAPAKLPVWLRLTLQKPQGLVQFRNGEGIATSRFPPSVYEKKVISG